MRTLLPLVVAGALAACSPELPESGMGFDNSPDAQRARELALTGGAGAGIPITPPAVVSDERVPPATTLETPLPPPTALAEAEMAPADTAIPADTALPAAPGTVARSDSSADIAAEAAAALAATRANSGVPPVNASPENPAPEMQAHAGISNENDFAAVSERRSIQGDAQQIARNRQSYEQVAPAALPARRGDEGPNIVSYALKTSHPRGTRVYQRSGINMAARARRNCDKYASPDQAQIDFLAKGGPERDRMGLDPDGDGYACAWNPAPFRRAASG